jgi:hypothetical protein
VSEELNIAEREVWPCDCECHKPAGWAWRRGDPRPDNLRPCGKCDYIQHMAPTAEQLAWELGPQAQESNKPNKPHTIGWQVSETYAIVKRMEKRWMEYTGFAAEQALAGKFGEAHLGLASNEELLRELITRFRMEQYVDSVSVSVYAAVDRALLLSEMLGGMGAPEREYRTVDHG